jgi:hypothetical protein
MQLKLIVILAVIQTLSIAVAKEAKRERFRLYFLGGQSNMEGHGLNAELPPELASPDSAIWIFHGNPTGDNDEKGGLGKWERLIPGNGAGFTADGIRNRYSGKFGPELSFGRRIAAKYPGEKIALIKYARGGSSIDSLAAREYGSWEFDSKGIENQYDHFLKTVNAALSSGDVDGDGVEDVVVPCGILWMQGESDAALSEEIARRYHANLKRLMELMRSAFRDDELPVVIGKISDSGLDNNGKTWRHGELVQHAQEVYVENDKNAAIVRDTRLYGYSDPWHYDSQGYISLGIQFAEAVFGLDMASAKTNQR